jgi:hypothetical protein
LLPVDTDLAQVQVLWRDIANDQRHAYRRRNIMA